MRIRGLPESRGLGFVPWRILALRVEAGRRRDETGLSIYALVDPRDELIRYVGYTSRELEARLATHTVRPVSMPMREWFHRLAREGLEPSIRRICWTTKERWERDETTWIAWCRSFGQLLNVDPGGVYRERRNGRLKITKRGKKLARQAKNAAVAYTVGRNASTLDDDPA